MQKRNYLSLTLVTAFAVAAALGIVAACSNSAKAKPYLIHKDAPHPGVVAKIDGQEITEEQLIGDEKMEYMEIKKREYDFMNERLEKVMQDIFLGAEAKKAGMSLDDYITKKIVGSKVKISGGEYKKFVADRHIPESQINDQIKQRIMSYLEQQKRQDIVNDYVARLTKRNPVEVYFSKPKMQIQVDAGDAPYFGGKNAPVTIVEFSDFQCPFCGRAIDTVHAIKKKYGNKIKLAFRMFPLPMHPNARPAAEAAMCVNEQGVDKFWKYHDLLFKNQEKLDPTNLEKFAKDVGADVKKFDGCVAAKKYAEAVQKDIDYGEKLGVRSTPTFFVNGELIAGAVPIEQFTDVIDDELSDSKK